MKAKILLTVLITLFLACNNDDDNAQPQPDTQNSFTAIRNNQNWSGTTEIGLTAEDTLVFLGIGGGSIDDGVIVAKIKFDGKNNYKLNESQGIYYTTLGGDVLINQYAIELNQVGSFNINTYDNESRFIEGTFELPLKATRLYNSSTADSTLTITKGFFKGVIKEKLLY